MKTPRRILCTLIAALMLPVTCPVAGALPSAHAEIAEKQTFDHKPGIIGSNAYDLTVGASDTGFLDVGKRMSITDGYTWTITGTSSYGFYSIYIDANEKYELHRVVFTLVGKDTTFFPWAVTIPFESNDIERATSWVKDCQSNKIEGQLILGDAVWDYKPSVNGDGGTLTLSVDTCDAYTDYILDMMFQ